MSFQDAQKVINELIRNTETLAALGALLSEKAGEVEPHSTTIGKFKAVQRAIDPMLFDGVTQDEAQALRATILARARRAFEVVETPDQLPTWATDDPIVLQTQGKSSRIVTRLISDFAGQEESLTKQLSAPGRFLDVGSGAGWISISMAERWPTLQVDGLDIHQPALELAYRNAEASGLTERVSFRNSSVGDLDVVDVYSIAFIPFVFIPEAVLRQAVPALSVAIKEDGWLFVACYRKPESPLDVALWDLQTTMSGGRVWDAEEINDLVETNGFRFAGDIGEGTPINLYAARKV